MFKGMKNSFTGGNNNTSAQNNSLSADTLANAGISVSSDESASAATQVAPEQEVVNFTTSAFSVVHMNGTWVVVDIPIDPVTQQTGEWKIVKEDGTKMGAQERFKISAAMKLFA